MLLGVLLALAAGMIVIFVVSNTVGNAPHNVMVVQAARELDAGAVLSANNSTAPNVLISQAFVTREMNSDAVPADAYVYQNPDQLKVDLNDEVVVGQFLAGDVLRLNDKRLVKLGQGSSPGSLTLRNPAQLPHGSVLFDIPLDSGGSKSWALVPGDHIDILVTYCVSATGNCATPDAAITQTTLQNVYVYWVNTDQAFVVLTHQQALELKYLLETGKVSVVLRSPGDTDSASTAPVTSQYIIGHFHIHP
jgi:Flp pilus assembly protein CpaB